MDYIFHPFGTNLCYVDSDNEVVHFYGLVRIWTWLSLIRGILTMLHPLGMSLSTLWTWGRLLFMDLRSSTLRT